MTKNRRSTAVFLTSFLFTIYEEADKFFRSKNR